ncbi:hypothetical protein D1007_17746 [Hordeum vulgare]|nr:hypothetical protein D1007_17746 [Hordeum vulgare]
MAAEATEAEAARNKTPQVPQLRTQAEQMAFLVSSLQGMEKNIREILQHQKSLKRVVETKFQDMDVKVMELNSIVKQLQHDVDSVQIPRSDDDDNDESPPRTSTHVSTKPRSATIPAPKTRQTSSTQASAPSAPLPASTHAPLVFTPPSPEYCE